MHTFVEERLTEVTTDTISSTSHEFFPLKPLPAMPGEFFNFRLGAEEYGIDILSRP